jgi:hypothetical protein
VSKSRGKSEPSSPGGGQKPSALDGNGLWNSPAAQWGIAAIVAAAFLAYLALFFFQKLAEKSVNTRLALFSYLLTPDDLAWEWVGRGLGFGALDRWPILLAAILLVGLSLAIGFVGLWGSRALPKTTHLERYVLRIGVGLQLVSLFVLAAGLAGIGFGIVRFLIQPLLFGTAMGLAHWIRRRTSREPLPQVEIQPQAWTAFPGDQKPATSMERASKWSLLVVCGLFTALVVLGAMLPPWDFDVREYHLQAPKEWNYQGRITFLPHNVYGNMPQGTEAHALSAMQIMDPWHRSKSWWWGALTGKLLVALFAPLTGLLLYSAGRRLWSELAGLAAAAIYLSSPWVMHVSVNGLNEVALGFYLLTALYATFLGGKGRPCAGLAGFFAGAAASVKYTAALFVIFPLFLIMLWHGSSWAGRWMDPKSPQKLRWRPYAAIFLLMAALSCGLWYGKNLMLTGNPVYPLLGNVFGGKSRTPEKTEQWNRAHRPKPYNLKQLGISAANIGWQDQFQSPLLVPLTLLGVVAVGYSVRHNKKPPSAQHSSLFTPHSVHILLVTTLLLLFFLAAWWLFTHRLERFLVPAIPLAALLAGAGVEYVRNKPLKYVVAGLMVIGLTYNLLMSASPLVGDNRWFVSLERLRTDEPKTDQDPSRVKAAIRWLNEHAKPDEAVLCVGEAAVFDLEMPVFYNTCFDDCLLVNWTENKTAAERKEELRSRKIAYVYFDEAEIKRYRSDDNYGYDPRFDARLFDELVSQGVLQQPLSGAPPKIYPVVP